MDKLWDYLHHMDLTNEKPWKNLTVEIFRIKEDAVSHVDLRDWAENMEYSVSNTVTNLLERLQGLEGSPPLVIIHRQVR